MSWVMMMMNLDHCGLEIQKLFRNQNTKYSDTAPGHGIPWMIYSVDQKSWYRQMSKRLKALQKVFDITGKCLTIFVFCIKQMLSLLNQFNDADCIL